MYAVIKTGGKQYKVAAGSTIYVEKLDTKNDKISFDEILSVFDGEKIHIGTPILNNSSVICKKIKDGKEKKIIVYRTKAKSNWRKKYGHRQPYTFLFVEEIIFNGKSIDKKKFVLPTRKIIGNETETIVKQTKDSNYEEIIPIVNDDSQKAKEIKSIDNKKIIKENNNGS